MSRLSKDYWIDKLGLLPHPEGGFYKETYRSSVIVESDQFKSTKRASTGIYFLLTSDNFSAFHRIKSDEMWHFYYGDPIQIHIISPEGEYSTIFLGSGDSEQFNFQAVVDMKCWFATEVLHPGQYALVGCTVAPGFEFNDFEMAHREKLMKQFSHHSELIRKFTR